MMRVRRVVKNHTVLKISSKTWADASYRPKVIVVSNVPFINMTNNTIPTFSIEFLRATAAEDIVLIIRIVPGQG